ncbi:MAG: DarT ssDNA thymidine ADP-ribosyltransferase family protein [Holophaga sp.]|jgi:hypothetical protein
MSKLKIKELAQTLEIPYLLHFTRIINLPSILEYGLYPISRAHEIQLEPEINDPLRLDGHPDSVSLSIGWPNCQMFYKYRMVDQKVEWVVIAINPSVLWTKNCAFCKYNAADSRVSCLDIESLMNKKAFNEMFKDNAENPSRVKQKLKTYDPTDVQAEVLVFDVIEPELIIGVVFNTNQSKNGYTQFANKKQRHIVNPGNRGFFGSRSYSREF